MYCQSCGVSNPVGATTCRVCGKELVYKSSIITCPSCGAVVQATQSTCTKCGAGLAPSDQTGSAVVPSEGIPDESVAALPQETPTDAPVEAEPLPIRPVKIRVNVCPICGRPKGKYADMCDQCKQYEIEHSGYGDSDTTYSNEIDLPRMAGALIMLGGVLGIAHGLLTIDVVFSSDLPLAVGCITGLMFVFGFVAIAGGINAWTRQNAVLAILGAMFGVFSVGFYVGATMSLFGLVLVLKSRREFAVQKLSLDI